jgi:hypothetical protein
MRVLILALILSATSGCVAVVPFVQPDSQAQGISSCISCRASLRYREAKFAVKESRYEKLLNQLQTSSDVNKVHAAYWLGEMRGDAVRATPHLVKALSENNNWVRRAAAKALGKIGDPRSLPALKAARNDRDKFVSESAKLAVKSFGQS